jgi:hypothetical protein
MKGETIMENYEVMENEELETMDEVCEGTKGAEATESGHGFGLTVLAIGGGLTLVGLAVAGIKKLKDKKADKPKKVKTKLRLVRVPVEDDVEAVAEEVVEEVVED